MHLLPCQMYSVEYSQSLRVNLRVISWNRPRLIPNATPFYYTHFSFYLTRRKMFFAADVEALNEQRISLCVLKSCIMIKMFNDNCYEWVPRYADLSSA